MKGLKQLIALLCIFVFVASLAACAASAYEKAAPDQKIGHESPVESGNGPDIGSGSGTSGEGKGGSEAGEPLQNGSEEKTTEVDLKKIKANENGQVMILMYHGIGEKEAEWVRTAENFKKDLNTLYDNGYRLISLKDYIENNIKVQAGYTPFVLTFDDGLRNNFNILEEGGDKKIDPNCAVGIMEEFKKEHPDFGSGGTFFVYYPIPFRQKELIKEKYEFLIQNGYDIGNHSYTHENLGGLSIQDVQKALAKNVVSTREYLPEYDIYALALPFGIGPKGDNYKYAVRGEYDGTEYNHKAVLKVGSNPAPSPVNLKFDPERLSRVRASEMKTDGVGIYDWFQYFEKKPEKRYISDGNPDTVAIPLSEAENVNRDRLGSKELVIYE